MRWVFVGASVAVVAAIGVLLPACRRSASVAAPSSRVVATTAPATLPAVQNYHNEKFGIVLAYPLKWKPQPTPDFQWVIVPANGLPAESSITLDIPDLPTHLPGFIPIYMVYDGYISDLKKKWADVQAAETAPVVPNAHARLARCTGSHDGHEYSEQALLIVHNDHVYILRANCLAKDVDTITPIFEEMCKSLQWK